MLVSSPYQHEAKGGNMCITIASVIGTCLSNAWPGRRSRTGAKTAPRSAPHLIWRLAGPLASIAGLAWLAIQLATPNPAQAVPNSRCLAVANALPAHVPVRYVPSALTPQQVRVTYVTHATFLIESAAGVTIATDFAGFAGPNVIPRAVTMNHAHETHYTDFIDPGIEHVFRGWNPEGGPARHHKQVDDVLIRNVPTDIRNWTGEREQDGNSIFIFEVADMCIGHLGHLHHELAPEDLAVIGQLDVIMAPVDGTFTLDQDSMVKTLKVLRARIVIPMHAFGPSTLQAFLDRMQEDFTIDRRDSSTVVLSAATLPKTPTVLVLPEGSNWSWE